MWSIKDVRDIINDLLKGIVNFAKGEMILFFITFILLSIGFIIIDIPVAILVALVISIFDLLPVVGSGMIMIPWAVISLISGDTYHAIGVGAIYLFITIARQILDPVIVGHKIGVRPLYTFLSSIIFSLWLGPIGLLVGPMSAILITSIIRIRKNKAYASDKIEKP